MAVIKQVGGKRSGTFQWQGATVLKAWEDQIQAGLEAEAEEIAEDLAATLHRDSGQLADESFAVVEVRGTKRTIRAGSDAPHTAFHELGTSNFEGHPQIRQIMDRHVGHVTERIRAARGRG